MYHVDSEWHRLKTCVVGRSWSPEFYQWIKDAGIRTSLEQIAEETENDLSNLTKLLNSLGVITLRPNNTIQNFNVTAVPKSPLAPRDNLLMLGNKLIKNNANLEFYQDIIDHVTAQGNTVYETDLSAVCGATVYQFRNNVFFSNHKKNELDETKNFLSKRIKSKKINPFYHSGHIDGWFCPVTPGLIIAVNDPVNHGLLQLFFKTYFHGWEVLYIDPTLQNSSSFRLWQTNHTGSWWIPGQESNQQLTDFIDSYFKNSIGYVAETVFELNMLIIDSKNVVISGYNEKIFDALTRHQVNIHLAPFKHKCFWDNGIHCVTADLHREEN